MNVVCKIPQYSRSKRLSVLRDASIIPLSETFEFECKWALLRDCACVRETLCTSFEFIVPSDPCGGRRANESALSKQIAIVHSESPRDIECSLTSCDGEDARF